MMELHYRDSKSSISIILLCQSRQIQQSLCDWLVDYPNQIEIQSLDDSAQFACIILKCNYNIKGLLGKKGIACLWFPIENFGVKLASVRPK